MNERQVLKSPLKIRTNLDIVYKYPACDLLVEGKLAINALNSSLLSRISSFVSAGFS